MNIIFELSKEHALLPADEVFSCFQAEQLSYEILAQNQDVLILDTSVTEECLFKLSQRLAFTFTLDEFFFSCTPIESDLVEKSKQHPFDTSGSLAIRYRNRSATIDSQPLVKTLAGIYTKQRQVDLHHPDHELRMILTDSTVYVGRKITSIDRSAFEKRKVQYRPFFSPVSLHPKWARALVNLAHVRAEDVLLDPFCGTGGILLEAGLMGITVSGCDIDETMVSGCTRALGSFDIQPIQMDCCDIGQLRDRIPLVDAVVTDFPYGKSTTTKGEPRSSLYRRAFEAISFNVKPGGKVVVGLPDEQSVSVGEDFFTLETVYEVPVHRSLTRFFSVFTNGP